MAPAPKKAKKSAAQVKAGQAFAAAGRASQAKTRAAYIKANHGKKPPVSAARHAAGQKAAAQSAANARARKAGKTPVAAKARAAVAPTELFRPGSNWPSACNEYAPTCASVAVACHLQAATGIGMLDADILKLHAMAGGESGATIGNVLEALAEHGSELNHGWVRLVSFFRTDEQFLTAGLVVGVTLGHTGHAVLSAPGGMISWGQFMPWQGEPEEAWCLEWGP